MSATFGAIHTTAVCAVPVVEKLCRQTCEYGALCRGEFKLGHGGAVLTEVYHKCFAGLEIYYLSWLEFLHFHHRSVVTVVVAGHSFPCVCFHRFDGEVFAEIYFGTVAGINVAGKFGVHLRFRHVGSDAVHRVYASVVFLAVENACMCHRSADACAPVVGVRPDVFFRAVGKSELEHPTESSFFANHAVVVLGSDDFVAPPARSYLHRQCV